MREAPTLVTRAVHRSTIAVTELKCDQRNFGMTAPIPPEEAYLIGLQLLPCLDHDLYFEGRFVRPTNWFSGALTIYDLRRSPIADIRDPYHCLMFHLPRTGLEAVAQELGSSGIDDLRHRPGAAVDDPTVRHLLFPCCRPSPDRRKLRRCFSIMLPSPSPLISLTPTAG